MKTSLAECYRWVREVTGPLNAVGRRRGLSPRERPRHHAEGLQGSVEEPLRGRLEVHRRRPRARRRRVRRTRCRSSSRRCSRARTRRSTCTRVSPSAPPRSSTRSARRRRSTCTARACSAAPGAAPCASPSRRRAATWARRARPRRRTPTARYSITGHEDLHLRRRSRPAPRTSSTSCSRASKAPRPAPRASRSSSSRASAPTGRQPRRDERRRGRRASSTRWGSTARRPALLNFGENGKCIGEPVGGDSEAQQGHAADVHDDERRAHRRRHAGRRGRVDRVPERARVREGAQAGRVDHALEGRDRAARGHHRARRRAAHAPRHEGRAWRASAR